MRRKNRPGGGRSTQSWAAFLLNHSSAVLACDFFVVVTATFQRCMSSSFSMYRRGRPIRRPRSRCHLRARGGRRTQVDVDRGPAHTATSAAGECVLRTVLRHRTAESLDWIIPRNERHLRHVLAEWIAHYNAERPHSALGPGLPDNPAPAAILTGHELPPGWRVAAEQRLGGLHHHYGLERAA